MEILTRNIRMENCAKDIKYEEEPSIKLLSEESQLITIEISNISKARMNKCRKIALGQIECWAFDDIVIEGDNSLKREALNFRLSLIPVSAKLENEPIFSLSVQGKCRNQIITSSDLVCETGNASVTPNITIGYLQEGETLECTLKCKRGSATEHAKWSSVSTFSYKEISSNTFLAIFSTVGQYTSDEIIREIINFS